MQTLDNSIRLNGFTAAEVTTTKVGQSSVTKFSVATSTSRKNKTTGEYEQFTDWHNCEAWGKIGEYVSNNLRKGTAANIEGKLEYSTYEKTYGEGKTTQTVKHTRAVIRVNQIQLRNKNLAKLNNE